MGGWSEAEHEKGSDGTVGRMHEDSILDEIERGWQITWVTFYPPVRIITSGQRRKKSALTF
jgi:hypothetical protein